MTDKLTFLRFIASISVVIFHYGSYIFPFDREPLYTMFRSGYTAVSFFFLLSGFILVQAYGAYEKLNTRLFFINRLARLYPLYFLALLLYLISCHLQLDAASNETPIGLVLNLLMIQSWVPGFAQTFNIPAWSLSCELFFYLMFPLAISLFARIGRSYHIIIILFFIVTQTLFSMALHQSAIDKTANQFIYYSPTFHLATFLFGTSVGLLFKNNALNFIQRHSTLFLSGSVFLILLFIFLPVPGLIIHNGVFAPLYAVLIISVCYSPYLEFLKNKFLRSLGEASYAVYILQFPFYYIFINASLIESQKINFYVYVLTLVLISWLAYYFIEMPIRYTVKKKILLHNPS